MFQFLRVFLGIETADGDAAGIGSTQAFEDFHGGGFAGSVGAQQAEDFAFFYGKADAADGLQRRRSLDEIFNL